MINYDPESFIAETGSRKAEPESSRLNGKGGKPDITAPPFHFIQSENTISEWHRIYNALGPLLSTGRSLK